MRWPRWIKRLGDETGRIGMIGAVVGVLVAGSVLGGVVVSGNVNNGGGCPSSTPYTPDSADPFGGCWPGEQTVGLTGVGLTPASLATYTGSCSFTGSGTVTITEKKINCRIENTTGTTQINVVRSELNGGYNSGDWSGSCTRFLTITDSDIRTSTTQDSLYFGDRGVEKNCFDAQRDVITGGISCGWVEYNATIKDSYCADQGLDQWGCTRNDGHRECLHESGVRSGSGTAQRLEHNVISCNVANVNPLPGYSGDTSGCSADVTGYGDFADIQNNTVTKNLFPATLGGVCTYGGNSTPKTFPNGANNVWTQNYYTKWPQWPTCGWDTDGKSTSGFNTGISGNSFTNNWIWDGSTLTAVTPIN